MANNIHHATDDTDIQKSYTTTFVSETAAEFPANFSGPQPYLIEWIGIFTQMVRPWWVVVLAAALMANVLRKPPTLWHSGIICVARQTKVLSYVVAFVCCCHVRKCNVYEKWEKIKLQIISIENNIYIKGIISITI